MLGEMRGERLHLVCNFVVQPPVSGPCPSCGTANEYATTTASLAAPTSAVDLQQVKVDDNEPRTLDPEGWYTHDALADAHGLNREATRKKLFRLRKKDLTCFQEVRERSRNSPKYKYQYKRVRDVLVGRAQPERPPRVRREDPRARPAPPNGG